VCVRVRRERVQDARGPPAQRAVRPRACARLRGCAFAHPARETAAAARRQECARGRSGHSGAAVAWQARESEGEAVAASAAAGAGCSAAWSRPCKFFSGADRVFVFAWCRHLVAPCERRRPAQVGEPCHWACAITLRFWLLYLPHAGKVPTANCEHLPRRAARGKSLRMRTSSLCRLTVVCGRVLAPCVQFPEDYPSSAPHIVFLTTNGGKTRFNPNLYADGKVCLSILGTWRGESGEQWSSVQNCQVLSLPFSPFIPCQPCAHAMLRQRRTRDRT